MIKRYDLPLTSPDCMQRNDAGEYVRYEDHAAEVERLRAKNERLRAEVHTVRAELHAAKNVVWSDCFYDEGIALPEAIRNCIRSMESDREMDNETHAAEAGLLRAEVERLRAENERLRADRDARRADGIYAAVFARVYVDGVRQGHDCADLRRAAIGRADAAVEAWLAAQKGGSDG